MPATQSTESDLAALCASLEAGASFGCASNVETLASLVCGSEVQISGLKASPELNGATGVVVESGAQHAANTPGRLAVLVHRAARPKPADYHGGSWSTSSRSGPKPLALRPQSLRLIGPATLNEGRTLAAECRSGDMPRAAIDRVFGSRELLATVLVPLLLEPTMLSLRHASATSKQMCSAVAHLIQTRGALFRGWCLGGEGSYPGLFRSPACVAALAGGVLAVGELGNRRLQFLTVHGVPQRVCDGRFELGLEGARHTKDRFVYLPRGLARGSEESLVLVGARQVHDWDDPEREQTPTVCNHLCNLIRIQPEQPDRIEMVCGGDIEDWTSARGARAVAYDAVSEMVYLLRHSRDDGLMLLGLDDGIATNGCRYERVWGEHIVELPTAGLRDPCALATGGDSLFVCDRGACCIVVYGRAADSTFAHVARTLGRPGERAGELTDPRAVACDDAGERLFIAEERRIQVFSALSGAPLQVYAPLGVVRLSSLCLSDGRRLVAADEGAHKLHVMTIGGGGIAQLQRRAEALLHPQTAPAHEGLERQGPPTDSAPVELEADASEEKKRAPPVAAAELVDAPAATTDLGVVV